MLQLDGSLPVTLAGPLLRCFVEFPFPFPLDTFCE